MMLTSLKNDVYQALQVGFTGNEAFPMAKVAIFFYLNY